MRSFMRMAAIAAAGFTVLGFVFPDHSRFG